MSLFQLGWWGFSENHLITTDATFSIGRVVVKGNGDNVTEYDVFFVWHPKVTNFLKSNHSGCHVGPERQSYPKKMLFELTCLCLYMTTCCLYDRDH